MPPPPAPGCCMAAQLLCTQKPRAVRSNWRLDQHASRPLHEGLPVAPNAARMVQQPRVVPGPFVAYVQHSPFRMAGLENVGGVGHGHEEISLTQLEDDCRLLSTLLDDTLRLDVGAAGFSKLNKIRCGPRSRNWRLLRLCGAVSALRRPSPPGVCVHSLSLVVCAFRWDGAGRGANGSMQAALNARLHVAGPLGFSPGCTRYSSICA